MHFKKYIVMCLCPRGTVFGSFITIQQRSHAFPLEMTTGLNNSQLFRFESISRTAFCNNTIRMGGRGEQRRAFAARFVENP